MIIMIIMIIMIMTITVLRRVLGRAAEFLVGARQLPGRCYIVVVLVVVVVVVVVSS